MKFRKDFVGLDGFYWWFGVVENRKDPLELGRCQVRVFGAHSNSLTDIPSEDLPWAHPVHALNNQAFSTPKEGDYVFGFFVDGKAAQSPVMVGIVPGIPSSISDSSIGFNDIRTTEDIADAPMKPEGLSFALDGTGVEITEPDKSDEDVLEAHRYPLENNVDIPSNSNLTRNQKIPETPIQYRRDNVIPDIPTAGGSSWSEPYPAYAAKYPYNKVTETESGHVLEFDDTPGAERIHMMHRSGTFQEMYPSGSKVEKIVKNNYQIVLSDDNIYVVGKVNITVGSHANIKVAGDVTLQAENNLLAGVAGDALFSVGGMFGVKAANIVLESDSDISALAAAGAKITSAGSTDISAGTMAITSLGALTMKSTGALAADGAAIFLNSGIAAPGEFAVPAGLPAAPAIGEYTMADPFIEPTPGDESSFLFDSGEEGTDEHIQNQIDSGVYTQENIDEAAAAQEGESDQQQAPDLSGTTNCGGIEELGTYSEALQLTSNYTLGELSGAAPFGDTVRAQHGLAKGDIICNLKLLAVNCLEPILARYPDMKVTNAFRKISGSGRSQHEVGQAADMQFPAHSKSEYYDIVRWIRDNVPHDQLLLEYKTYGTRLPWIHISFNKAGNRPPGGAKNATFLNNKIFKPYFTQLA